MQNRAVRVITGKSYEISSSDVLKELGWHPLANRGKQNKVIFMYKIRNNEYSESMTSMFSTSKNQKL